MKIIDTIIERLYNLIEIVCKLLLVLMVITVSYTVFCRFVLNDSPSWGEETGIFILVWIAILSISLGIKDGRHIRMTLLEFILPKKVSILLDMIGHVVILLVAIVMLKEGIALTLLSVRVKMPAMGISSAWMTSVVPITGVAIIVMLIGKVRANKWL